jgi:hypothetical protein
MADGSPCGRELYDDSCCLLHSARQKKDVGYVQVELNKAYSSMPSAHDFTRCVFPEGVVFPNKFKMRALFQGAIFEGSADFNGRVFDGDADFTEAKFEEDADFEGAVFREKVLFKDTLFEGKANFYRAVFHDSVRVSAEKIDRKAFRREANFSRIVFLQPEEVRFRKIDLSKTRFLSTDVRRVRFVDVDWCRRKGRDAVYDEHVPSLETRNVDYALIARLYRWLRANYEQNLRYPEAGDFYIGEMEMRRKAENSVLKKLPLLFYKAMSNYGESYYRPLCWIAVILLFFPILFMFAGIQPFNFNYGASSDKVISYKLDFSSFESITPTWEEAVDYYTCFLYSMSVFSFIRDKKFTTINNWGHTLFVAESILGPATLAFFLLALRRRFKR